MNQKKVRLLIVAVVVIIAIVAIVKIASNNNNDNNNEEEYVEELANGTKVNTSKKLAETKTYNGLEFTNIKFTNSSAVTNLRAEVKNTTANDMPEQIVDINVLDKDRNVLTTFRGQIGAVKAGETTIISAGIAANYANAYDLEIVEPK